VLAIAAMAAADANAVTRLNSSVHLAGATVLIPPGACVLTDTVSVTIVVGRFSARSAGCPAMIDAVGTLIATTGGQDLAASLQVRLADTRVWQAAFSRAQYVWLVGNGGYTGARIVWTPALYAYFVSHFQLLGFPGGFPGGSGVPAGGLYLKN
jgi:hypothetical protein